MPRIRIGAPNYLSVGPLTYGLTEGRRPDTELIRGGSAALADALERGVLDAALIPSIEFLRGAGSAYIHGPALVADGKTQGVVLVAKSPLNELRRIAVTEHCRTPLAVLRIALDRLYGALPDFCVFKAEPANWRDAFDGMLISGDDGMRYCAEELVEGETCHDVGTLWDTCFSSPLVMLVWAYNDEALGDTLGGLLTDSRDFAMKNLSRLSDSLAPASGIGGEDLYRYFSTAWRYQLGPEEEKGLHILEEHALAYQLIQHRRLDKPLIGQR